MSPKGVPCHQFSRVPTQLLTPLERRHGVSNHAMERQDDVFEDNAYREIRKTGRCNRPDRCISILRSNPRKTLHFDMGLNRMVRQLMHTKRKDYIQDPFLFLVTLYQTPELTQNIITVTDLYVYAQVFCILQQNSLAQQ